MIHSNMEMNNPFLRNKDKSTIEDYPMHIVHHNNTIQNHDVLIYLQRISYLFISNQIEIYIA